MREKGGETDRQKERERKKTKAEGGRKGDRWVDGQQGRWAGRLPNQ